MTSVGYGDITPQHSLEIIYTIFISIISVFVFSFTVSILTFILYLICINIIG